MQIFIWRRPPSENTGNNLEILLPKDVIEKIRLKGNDEIGINTDNRKIIIEKINKSR